MLIEKSSRIIFVEESIGYNMWVGGLFLILLCVFFYLLIGETLEFISFFTFAGIIMFFSGIILQVLEKVIILDKISQKVVLTKRFGIGGKKLNYYKIFNFSQVKQILRYPVRLRNVTRWDLKIQMKDGYEIDLSMENNQNSKIIGAKMAKFLEKPFYDKEYNYRLTSNEIDDLIRSDQSKKEKIPAKESTFITKMVNLIGLIFGIIMWGAMIIVIIMLIYKIVEYSIKNNDKRILFGIFYASIAYLILLLIKKYMYKKLKFAENVMIPTY